MKKKKIIWIVSESLMMVLLSLLVVCIIYVNIYYKAEASVYENIEDYTIIEEKHYQVFVPEEYEKGIIFYPGGKVEEAAYIPFMEKLADQGILAVLVKMPFRLAVFGQNRADEVLEQFTEVEEWYLCGHSLGGAMAASYASKHAQQLEGLILLAAYSTADLSQSELNVLSIYGEHDQVLNREAYSENLCHLPEDYQEEVIAGGCHSYFGSYGMQKKDGIPTISNEEQLNTTVSFILSWIAL